MLCKSLTVTHRFLVILIPSSPSVLIFSNSLIIHQVKTKKITTVKEVWIPCLNKHRFWRFYFSVYSSVLVSFEKLYQTLQTVFHRLSKHLEFHQKYSAARRIFNSLLGVWITQWNTVSHVWYGTSSLARVPWQDSWSGIMLFKWWPGPVGHDCQDIFHGPFLPSGCSFTSRLLLKEISGS